MQAANIASEQVVSNLVQRQVLLSEPPAVAGVSSSRQAKDLSRWFRSGKEKGLLNNGYAELR
jgi:hypothetical protein